MSRSPVPVSVASRKRRPDASAFAKEMDMTHGIHPLREKSINELEAVSMRPPYPTVMIERVARARSIAIGALESGDLRLLVSQGVGLSYLWPVALERLADHPLLWAELYRGDLLSAALHAEEKYGATAEHRERLREITARALDELSRAGPADWSGDTPYDPNVPDEIDREALAPKLQAARERLKGSRPAV
jgi:hypothetical protein